VDYGDTRALAVLAQTFDALPIREGDNPLANRVFIELRCAIEDLGGALTVAQQAKFAQADAARRRLVAQLPWALEAPAPPPCPPAWRDDLCAPLGRASWAGTPPVGVGVARSIRSVICPWKSTGRGAGSRSPVPELWARPRGSAPQARAPAEGRQEVSAQYQGTSWRGTKLCATLSACPRCALCTSVEPLAKGGEDGDRRQRRPVHEKRGPKDA